jgi:lipopolysaccharide/colanic/teichoic acid biosynthesis glycosyltransferase
MVTLLIAVCAGTVGWLGKQVAAALVGQQIRGTIPDYTTAKVREAVKLLPPHLAEPYEKDWLGELAALGVKPMSALRFAWGLARAARGIAIEAKVPARQCPRQAAWHRLIDLSLGAVLVFLLAPLLVSVWLLVRGQGGRRIIGTVRTGREGQLFRMLAFATDHGRGGSQSTLDRMLGETRLAQLPVLVNLLRGDMSIIGPPPLPAALYKVNTPRYPWLAVRPGIASWETLVRWGRTELSLEEAHLRDRQRSVKKDLALLARSVVLLGAVRDDDPARIGCC